MTDPHLVIAAFWTTAGHDEATDHVAQSLDGLALKGHGSVVSIKNPDAALFRWLRNVQLQEAAQSPPPGKKDQTKTKTEVQ